MKRVLVNLSCLIALGSLFLCQLHSQALSEAKDINVISRIDNALRSRTLLNINNIAIWVQNDGQLARSPLAFFLPTDPLPLPGPTTNWGLIYPRGAAGLVYADNIVWVGKVIDAREPAIRTGGGLYSTGTVPGVIVRKGIAEDSNNPSVRVFRIRKDYATADLRQDAAEVFNKFPKDVTPEMIEAVRAQYEKDWREWPWQKGAPFEDKNGNETMDIDEYPGFQNADQVVWFAYNDLDENASKAFYASPSTGLEVQVTLWGYKGIPEFENVVFKRYRFIYKGASTTPVNAKIDSMYISQWVDPDVGNFWDDLGGCDSLLSLGFAYSNTNPDGAYKPYGWQNPGIGYLVLQGPLVPGDAKDEGIFDFNIHKAVKNLPMTSFLLNATGDPISEPPLGSATFWYWNVVRGFTPWPATGLSFQPYINPTGETTKFMAAGDPITGRGWVDGVVRLWGGLRGYGFSLAPGERRFMMNTGPFTLVLGDTQEIVIAIVAGMGADGRQSTAVVKHNAKLVRSIYPYLAEKASEEKKKIPSHPVSVPKDFYLSQNYPNPFNPSTRIQYALPIETDARLTIHDVLGREIKVLVDRHAQAGVYSLEWDGRDQQGNLLPSGVYFYQLQAGYVYLSRKLLLLR